MPSSVIVMNSVILNNKDHHSLVFSELVASSKEHLEARVPDPVVWWDSIPYVHCNGVIYSICNVLAFLPVKTCIALSSGM